MTLSEKIREEGIAIGEVKSLIKTTTALNLGYDAENKENIQTLMTLAIE